tara:strand:+ start:808 stop:954 length:147 start_codon:yes stop_codon:yes gene_type:complete
MTAQIVVELKKKPLQIYLTDEQKIKLKKIAAKEGLTMTGYIVDIIRSA